MVGKRLGGFRPAAVAEAHAQFLAGDLAATAGVVRGEVIESWERSRRSVAPLLDALAPAPRHS